MSYINNMNPRRMIWFNQNAPKNKMDLWLSYNRHYEDTSEDETVDPQLVDDNPNLRKCDLILKAWDCGRWIPIVGFNTTAANKIDIVEGNTLYHPAIFTGENPNDLYDAGTLGSLLSDPNFVTELEWHDVFNSSNYDWGYIFGDTTWFGDLTWSIIQGGSSSYHLPWATRTQCGGILSDIFTTYGSPNAFKPIEVKFYPTDHLAYQSKNHRLCVSASDVIDLIDEYYQDNPDPNNPVPIPIEGTFENTSSIGSSLLHTNANSNALKAQIYNVNSGNAGKFLRVKPLPEWPDIPSGQDAPSGGWNQVNCLVEWVDLPSGTTYTTLASGTASGIECVVLSGGSDKQFLNGYGEWAIPEGTVYASGVGIYIHADTNDNTKKINQHIYEKPADSATLETQDTNIEIVDNASGQVIITQTGVMATGQTTVESYNYTEITTYAGLLDVNLQNKNTNPIYIKLDSRNAGINKVYVTGDTICSYDLVASGIPTGATLITILFGAIKFETMKPLVY